MLGWFPTHPHTTRKPVTDHSVTSARPLVLLPPEPQSWPRAGHGAFAGRAAVICGRPSSGSPSLACSRTSASCEPPLRPFSHVSRPFGPPCTMPWQSGLSFGQAQAPSLSPRPVPQGLGDGQFHPWTAFFLFSCLISLGQTAPMSGNSVQPECVMCAHVVVSGAGCKDSNVTFGLNLTPMPRKCCLVFGQALVVTL